MTGGAEPGIPLSAMYRQLDELPADTELTEAHLTELMARVRASIARLETDPEYAAQVRALADLTDRQMAAEAVAGEVDARCRANGWEWHAEIVVASDCRWQCKLTIVLTPYRDEAPDRSLVILACNGDGPDDAFHAAWDDMQQWLGSDPPPGPGALRDALDRYRAGR
jgi:hypothetical protein